MSPTIGLLDMMADKQLLGPYFAGPSWSSWRTVLKGTLGERMTPREREHFHDLAERDPPPGRVREAWFAIGRRGGKDSIASAIAIHAAVFGQFERHVRPGERPVILLLASTREQAGGLLQYVRGYFETVPLLQPLVQRITGGLIELTTGVDIVIAASDYRSIRGRTVALAVLNEIAFWKDDSGRYQSPDTEIYSAILPSLVTLRQAGSLLIGISSVHRKLGLLYDKFVSYHGKPDPDVLVVKAPSRTFNPTISERDITLDMRLDPDKGRAEWLSEWRTDISSFIDREIVEGLVDIGIRERGYDPAIRNYVAFADESGGSGQDSSTLCIVHAEAGGLVVQDVARRWPPPFSPSDVIAEKAKLLRTFRLTEVSGDHWSGGIVPDLYRRNGVKYQKALKAKGDLYIDLLHILNSGRVRLLDEPVQVSELCNLERRVAFGGRASVDHPQNGHDDLANSLAGAVTMAATMRRAFKVSQAALEKSRQPSVTAPRRRSMLMPHASGRRAYW